MEATTSSWDDLMISVEPRERVRYTKVFFNYCLHGHIGKQRIKRVINRREAASILTAHPSAPCRKEGRRTTFHKLLVVKEGKPYDRLVVECVVPRYTHLFDKALAEVALTSLPIEDTPFNQLELVMHSVSEFTTDYRVLCAKAVAVVEAREREAKKKNKNKSGGDQPPQVSK